VKATNPPSFVPGTSVSPRIEPPAAEERSVEIHGARMRYLHAGSGPPVLLVHGLMGYSFSWRHLIPELAQRHDVSAMDAIGTGFSERPAGLDCSLKACAQRLLRFMDTLSEEKFDLVGTSHGGGVVLMAACLLPARVRRLVLVAPVNPWAPRGKRLAPFLSHPLVRPVFVQAVHRSMAMRRHYFQRLWGAKRRIPAGVFEGYMKPLNALAAWDYPMGILRGWNADLRELELALPRIREIPALLIWGSRDGAVSPGSAKRLRQNFREARLVMMEGVGHLPYEEEPEEFNRMVREFLD
jgi:pimeloyl-ACP methyl ester carboxylesterase